MDYWNMHDEGGRDGNLKPERSTKVSCHISAPPARVYKALIDADKVRRWRFPEGMSCEVHVFEPWEGGAIRISLTYEEYWGKGKTSAHTDTYSGRFLKLIPGREVVEVDAFESDDPDMKGEMTITTTLTEKDGGTALVALHEHLPPGVSLSDNVLGWEMALSRLKHLVESEDGEGFSGSG